MGAKFLISGGVECQKERASGIESYGRKPFGMFLWALNILISRGVESEKKGSGVESKEGYILYYTSAGANFFCLQGRHTPKKTGAA